MDRRENPGQVQGAEPALGVYGRGVRLAVTASVITLLIIATFWWDDSEFPFAPFRMFSTSASLNQPVKSTLLEGVTVDEERIPVLGKDVGLRRAEIEGQLPRFEDDPQLMNSLLVAYERIHPQRPALVQIDIVVRHFDLDNGRPTGTYKDIVVVSWSRDGRIRPKEAN